MQKVFFLASKQWIWRPIKVWPRIPFRERLNVGTVPTYKMHLIGTVPTYKMHLIGTVPMFKMHLVGTVPLFKKHIIGTMEEKIICSKCVSITHWLPTHWCSELSLVQLVCLVRPQWGFGKVRERGRGADMVYCDNAGTDHKWHNHFMTLPCYDSTKLQHCHAMTLPCYDITTLWHYHSMTLPHYDITSLWHYQIMKLPHYDISTLWHHHVKTFPHYEITTL